MIALPGMSAETAHELLNPADKQNVPKAVNLVQNLVKLQTLPASLNPTEIRRRRTLIFLARVLDHFVLPFNSIEMTLSEQVRSLSAYAHLAAAMYLKHGLAFLTGALYADSQAIVKNIIFCIARLQLINGNLKFYIILEGTDRLETIFSDVRTQDHSRNFDVLQLSQKLSVGAAISTTFEQHPDLDRGHRRLALKDAKGVDHVNPKSWKGDVRVGQVELAAEWNNGQDDANDLLEEYFGSGERANFTALWTQPGIDLLQPLHPGAYIGSQFSLDDERSERAEEIAGLDGPENDGDDEFEDLPLGMGIEDFLESEAASEPSAKNSSDNFLVVDNKKYMKASVVAAWLSSKRARKLTVRTLRARGVTLEDLRHPSDNWNSTDLTEGDIVKTGDLAACLVRTGESICLAIIEIISFEYDDSKRQLSCMTVDEMEESGTGGKSKITVLAQIMDMEQTNDAHWNWTRHYMRFETGKGKARNTSSDKSSQRNFVLHIPAMLVYPVGSSIVSLNPSSSHSAESSDASLTWSLAQADMTEILDFAWSELNPDSEEIIGNIELTPSLPDSMLPYRDRNGEFLMLKSMNKITLNLVH